MQRKKLVSVIFVQLFPAKQISVKIAQKITALVGTEFTHNILDTM